MIYVACKSGAFGFEVLVGTQSLEKAKEVITGEYWSNLSDIDGNEVLFVYWIEVYENDKVISIHDFDKLTLEFSKEVLK